MNKANAPKTTIACSVPFKIGDEELVCVSHNHMTDASAPVDHDAQLPVERPRHFGHAAGQLPRNPLFGKGSSVVQSHQLPVLVGLQACGVSMQIWNGVPRLSRTD